MAVKPDPGVAVFVGNDADVYCEIACRDCGFLPRRSLGLQMKKNHTSLYFFAKIHIKIFENPFKIPISNF